ncbi:hypothetical protein F751_5366 [Auxenochlorella protothecoides]|uniref:Uncharacterized protein n=1 Tax=Auxenochlorella protothecoides TaxID=3075 RepID=A0A087SP56_AUXPR|nr:hypothetical protein F751_5366 [Auxenochlorella protothecoides]KFM27510.1 hypothetical protein F751_5366 [Auxenochlorella protothecoides]
MMYPDLADHNLICFLGSKMGSMYGGLDHMLAAVQENMAAAANRGELRDVHGVAVPAECHPSLHPRCHRGTPMLPTYTKVMSKLIIYIDTGLVATSKAGTGRRRGKEPMPVAEPPHGASPDLASISAKPDTQGPESATSPHPVDSGSEVPPLLSIPDTPAPSRESDSGLKEALRGPAIRVNLVAEKGVRAEHDTLYKHLMEMIHLCCPLGQLIPSPTSATSKPKLTASAPILRGMVARGGRLFRRTN